jgi:hypothetical protein
MLEIDIMGPGDCANFPTIPACANDGLYANRHECFERLGHDYKFILAIENSDCVDYITEKVWFNAFKHNMVPLVCENCLCAFS